MKPWAAIFDLDGIVVDTVPLHFQAWERMFREYGKAFTFEDYIQKVDGIPRTDGARAILMDLSESQLEEACRTKQKYFLALLDKEGVPVYESTVGIVKDMRSRGIKVALISSSKNLPQIIRAGGLTELWDVVLSGHDITRGKPDPQIFLMAAEKLGMSPSRCVVCEDAVLGVEAAKRAGMRCIGVDRHGNPGRLAQADAVVKDLSELSCDSLEEMMNR